MSVRSFVVSSEPPTTARPRSKASIYDVAALAGVSHQTVSRVINDRPHIRESTRAKVLSAMEEIQYTPSTIARALATNRTRRIGVLVDSPIQYGPSSTMRGIEEAARRAGYTVSAISVSDDAAGDSLSTTEAFDHLRAQGIDALCVIAPRYSMLSTLREQIGDLPTLVVKAEAEEELLTVGLDQYAGAVHAVDHLIALGHRHILHVAGPLDWADARVRDRAFSERMTAEGLHAPASVIGDWTSDFGFELARDPDGIPPEVTAIFAGNDQMALGIVHGLATRGLRVPEDVSVVGFDDLPDARHFLPPLTTVRQDFHALGALSMTRLIESLEGRSGVAGGMIEPQLIVRASTAPPRQRP